MKNAKNEANDIKNDLKKSSEDWINYIKKHPVQSVFFAITVYFAFKNIVETAKNK